MNISVLNVSQNYFVKGGSDSYFFALGELLKSRGFDVTPFAAIGDKNFSSEWERFFPTGANFDAPSPIDIVRFVYSFDAKRKMRELLNFRKIDVAHLHIYYGKLTSSILGVLEDAGVPIVQTLHEYKLACPVYSFTRNGRICEECNGGKFWKAAAYRCNRGSFSRSVLSSVESYVSSYFGSVERVNKFIAVSHFIKNKMIEHGVPREKIEVVHNFVDSSKFFPSSEIGEYFLYFGRIEWLKGVKTLIDAFEARRDVPLLVVGDGNARVEAEVYAHSVGAENVKFLGFKSGAELHELIRKSIATLLPAEWYENCPMSVLESLALGRPVIGTRIGGIPELIRHEEDGLLVDVASAEQLTAAVGRLWDDKKLAVGMGLRGRAKVVEEFNADGHVSKILQVYKSL